MDTPIRVYASLNGPGTLAPLLGLALLCCLTVRRHPRAGAGERGAADDRPVAHLRALGLGGADRRRRRARHRLSGRSARLILSAAALIVVTSIALAPFSHTASDVISRFNTIGSPMPTPRPMARQASFEQLFPKAVSAPLGHGLGTAGEATRLHGESDLRAVDNGYLSLLYQVGPIGFGLVMVALG